jgi:CDP-diacylglycerol--serine O-phosphatidyltransferase
MEQTERQDASDERSERPRRRHFALLRQFALADFITLANGASGMGAILLCVSYVEARATDVMWAALALFPVALVCDVLDGSVARWRRRSSPFGADLDSLADVVSFGVAPAVLAYALGMRGGWDAAVLIYFVGCGISRLARFNVTADELMTEKGKVSHFEGTPIPTSLLLVAVLTAAFASGAVHEDLWLGQWRIGPWLFHPLVAIYALSGTAMVSATLKIPKP